MANWSAQALPMSQVLIRSCGNLLLLGRRAVGLTESLWPELHDEHLGSALLVVLDPSDTQVSCSMLRMLEVLSPSESMLVLLLLEFEGTGASLDGRPSPWRDCFQGSRWLVIQSDHAVWSAPLGLFDLIHAMHLAIGSINATDLRALRSRYEGGSTLSCVLEVGHLSAGDHMALFEQMGRSSIDKLNRLSEIPARHITALLFGDFWQIECSAIEGVMTGLQSGAPGDINALTVQTIEHPDKVLLLVLGVLGHDARTP